MGSLGKSIFQKQTNLLTSTCQLLESRAGGFSREGRRKNGTGQGSKKHSGPTFPAVPAAPSRAHPTAAHGVEVDQGRFAQTLHLSQELVASS